MTLQSNAYGLTLYTSNATVKKECEEEMLTLVYRKTFVLDQLQKINKEIATIETRYAKITEQPKKEK